MDCQIIEENLSCLAEYGSVPISFRVDRILEIIPIDARSDEVVLEQRIIATPYAKDYDAIKGNAPQHWLANWNLSNWGVLSAFISRQRVGGVVLAFNTDGIDLLEGRTDLAVIWDLRVLPDYRNQGIGASLFQAAEVWAQAHGCKEIKVETQNINVAACSFYAKQGCRLLALNQMAYPDFPEEIQLLWNKFI